MITFYYYDKFGKKISAAKVDKRSFKAMRELLLEDSRTGDLGDIFYVDEQGEERCLDYYND
jgi:hypothetical protein